MKKAKKHYVLRAIDIIADGKKEPVFLLGNPPEYVESIVGIRFNKQGIRVVYSVDKLIECMIQRDGMPYEEALEHFEFNVRRSVDYLNQKNKPVFVK